MRVAIFFGSKSDTEIMKGAANCLKEFGISYKAYVLSAHRVPEKLEETLRDIEAEGCEVIIAGAGLAAHLPGVIAALTPLPVIGVPINSSNSIDGWDSILSILQMPAGIPVATVALDGAKNAGILAAQIIGTGEPAIFEKIKAFKADLANKISSANSELTKVKYEYKTN